MITYDVAVDIADICNREYQAGGDRDTLARVVNAVARRLSHEGISSDAFYDVAEMSGLSVREYGGVPRSVGA